MRVCSFTRNGERRVGVVVDGHVHDVTDQVPTGDGSPMRRLLASGLDPATLDASGPAVPDPDLLPPVPDPGKIVAAPVNYVDHQVEMSASQIGALGVFLKAPSSVLPHGGVVRLPYHDRRFDQEGELAVVIGRTASHVRAEDALDHVFGYTCLLDMTMRGGEDRSVRKSFDTFTPFGPTVVTCDEAGHIPDLELHTRVNGRLRQRADLEDLIWDVPRLIAYISSVMVLHPGDVIATGTPAGVGQVHEGDTITVDITGLDRLEVSVTAQGAVGCPTQGRDAGPRPPATLTPVFERDA
ncbi:hypothetical protein SUDANB60_06250 (plasmid) [Streptomyces sp. enrichment culture]|uniref:fumarylacetoacetate hydrolase family protein n=1 Tax=Streptomyces sp. enrichment culture TaxID=1795815 RepID=UPI003F54E3C7